MLSLFYVAGDDFCPVSNSFYTHVQNESEIGLHYSNGARIDYQINDKGSNPKMGEPEYDFSIWSGLSILTNCNSPLKNVIITE